jgi:hypothetical protein
VRRPHSSLLELLERLSRLDGLMLARGYAARALFASPDRRKPSLINFDFSNGLYIVPKELERGYLTIGKQKVEFHRTDGDN